MTPLDKGEGEAGRPDEAEAGAFQAAASGGAFTYGSRASFASAAGAPPISQYLARRGPSGWESENLSPPLLSGTYLGGAYQLFSPDLLRGMLASGWRCRNGGSVCAAENPALAVGALAGYRNLYLREGPGYQPLLSVTNSPAPGVSAADFRLALAGAASDLRHAVVSTCAALTADAVQVSAVGGCDPAADNLYLWSEGALSAVNLLPGQPQSAPGASLAAGPGAISGDGERVYWRGADGNLYLREGSVSVQADLAAGGSGQFQAAAADGSVAFFTKAGHLFRYLVGGSATDLTPAGGVQGVLGAAADGGRVYYLTSSGVVLWQGGSTADVAPAADLSNVPPATGGAQISADGAQLAFVSSVSLTGFPHGGTAEVYLYDAPADRLLCVSCNQFGAAPAGPASLPAARVTGDGPPLYKPRALVADGKRLFFDSLDALVVPDTDGVADVYEWEAMGTGSCSSAPGCLGLVSNGRTGADTFLDASADGTDVFFLTPASLVLADHERLDVYVARAGGGFPEPPPPAACEGDECQGPAPAPIDPAVGTAGENASNPAPRFSTEKRRGKHGHKKKKKRRHRGGGAGHRAAGSKGGHR